VARGIVEAALSEAAVNIGPINIASGVERHISDVAHTIADRFGASVIYGEPRPCDLRQQLGCLEYAKELFGWSPNVQWGDGIELTLSDVLARLDNNKVVPEITWT
jgi:nucleoside-diphosphate-sugar epimerase